MKKIRMFIILGIVAIILFVPGVVKKFSTWGTNKVANLSENVGKDGAKLIQYSQFNNTTLNGASILSAFAVGKTNNISVFVKTFKNANFTEYTKNKPYNITDKNNPNYIDNNAKFKFTLRKSTSGAVQSIQAVQV